MVGEFDEETLEIAVDRKDVLLALAAEPHHRRELQEEFDISKTTCHRIIRSFDENSFVQRTETGYEVTLLGRIVAEQVSRFEETVETAYRLDPLLRLIESSEEDIDDSVFTDSDVQWSVEREQPSLDTGVERVQNADVLRVLDWTQVPDLYLERIFDIMVENGTRSEAVYPKDEIQNRLERFPDLHDHLLEAGNGHRYWVYEEVPPWGMTIYDDSLVELRAYDQESGAHVLEATADDERAVRWAMDIFTDYRDRATRLTDMAELPDWGDYSW